MNIAIVFGGKSVEHDVSILTGLHAARHVMDGVNVHLVYLTRENCFLVGHCLSNPNYYINGRGKVHKAFFRDGRLFRTGGIRGEVEVSKIDCIVNCCHGGVGENGDLAGYFKVLGIPITSSDAFSAAKVMSKSFTREILASSKGKERFLQPKFVTLRRSDFVGDIGKNISEIVKKIGLPAIVKPDTLGSSIGISVVKDMVELESAIGVAFTMDDVVVVEQFLDNAAEINCAAFKSGEKIYVSVCEKIDKEKSFLDFDNKYMQEGGFVAKKSGGKQGEREEVIEPRFANVYKEIQSMTKRAYDLFGLKGVVRFDYLVTGIGDVENQDKNIKIYLNEANSVPGFLSYHLWHRAGMPYGLLIDKLVKHAVVDGGKDFTTKFKSDILLKNRGLVE